MFDQRAVAIVAVMFCALSWSVIGDGAFRLAHGGRGPGLWHMAYLVADSSLRHPRRSS